ncbi:SGNH hydrolase domain-containing protein [Micromonospora sp. NPDC050397]|uniref:acyltransferase family protein n=1 Tax=Micromonospora sp. NPDC050397 TaxID=3364279 RepID=UPI00384E604A
MGRSDRHRHPGGPRDLDQAAGFRADIEGLRGVAVLLVLLGHAGLPLLPGGFVGVDVFFVISGFLITGLLLGELRRTGRISLAHFYARRARRLLPAAGVVIVASLLLTYLFLPRIRWSDTIGDALASTLYAMNWRLAERSADYLRADQAPSILQHYWSLAVEEQFYLLWPLLLVAAVWLGWRAPGRHVRRSVGGRALVALALLAVASLAWSIHLGQADPTRAYVVTTTRIWELALGGGLAVLGPHLHRLPRTVVAVTGWAGLAAILLAATLLGPEVNGWPGYLALLPTLGTAAVIAAGVGTVGAGAGAGVGVAGWRAGPASLLGWRPIRAAGAVSYSWYLWHWPLLVVATARFGPLGPATGVGIVLASVVPAVLTCRLVENPVRRSAARPAYALRVGLAATCLPLLAGMGLLLVLRSPAPTPAGTAAPDAGASATGAPAPPLGAAVLGPEPRDDPAGAPVDHVPSITPDPLVARDDVPDAYRDDCVAQASEASLRTCVYGDREAKVEVVLAGDSHAAHWLPAVQVVAAERGWRLVTCLKAMCPFQVAPITLHGRPYESCTEWNRRLRTALAGADRPALLIVSGVTQIPLVDGVLPRPGRATAQAQTEALAQTWSEVAGTGLPLVVLRDTPAFRVDVAECVSANRRALTRCASLREAALAGGLPQERAATGLAGVHLVDLNDAICPTSSCAPVIGGTLVYRDSHHLTAAYARSLAPRLHQHLREALSGELPGRTG